MWVWWYGGEIKEECQAAVEILRAAKKKRVRHQRYYKLAPVLKGWHYPYLASLDAKP